MKLTQRRLARPSLGGMLATRQGSLLLAVLCAVCAAGILFFALNRYKTSLRPPVTQDTVLIATGEIAKGTPGTAVAAQKLYRSAPVAASQVTPGALTDASSLSTETATVDILPGQQLTAADFAAYTSISETLPPNMRAVSIAIGEAPGNTDVVQAGDHVDIYENLPLASSLTKRNPDANLTQGSSSAQGIVLPVIADALVLKPATPLPVKHDGVPIAGAEMIVAVPSNQAGIVVAAAMRNALYLTLRPTNSAPTPGEQLSARMAQLSSNVLNTLAKSFPTTIK